MIYRSIDGILQKQEIRNVPDRDGGILECDRFFDDWFLFAVRDDQTDVYSLVKLREQEHDREMGKMADGDHPGVTVSIIAFDAMALKECLDSPTEENRKRLAIEINRVVAYQKQNHHPALKAYFLRPEAQAPYLIADVYTKYIASFFVNGTLPLPQAYQEILKKRQKGKRYARLPNFLEQNNREAGEAVCDRERLYIRSARNLSVFEKRAILAVHTGNVSSHSFAAEIRCHAMFLTGLAKLRLPLIGSPYASAVRADMSIADGEFQGPTPYYDLSGKLVRDQAACHIDEACSF